MREIKFRAWNSIDKCFCDNLTTLTNLRGFIKSKHYHPMQFTGLKDKNGVEIYDGDIIKGYIYSPEEKFIVEFSADEFNCGFIARGIEVAGMINVWYQGIEVIGNIHQNPELLED